MWLMVKEFGKCYGFVLKYNMINREYVELVLWFVMGV